MKEELLNSIALTWAQRAQAELGAEARFKILARNLADVGAPDAIVALARKAQSDEERHAKMCRDVAVQYGHPSGFEKTHEGPTNIKKEWLACESDVDCLLSEVTLMCCITETINASLLNTIYGSSGRGEIRKTIQEILKDEVKHSHIGWAYLSTESQKRDCSFLRKYIPQMFSISR